MNKHAQEVLDSIIEDFVLCNGSREDLEAKAIFRLFLSASRIFLDR
jgi:hypothetical protein